jgi:transcriptional regulator with XRE-family HTH domain
MINERLKEERVRLDMSQTQMGKVGGVSKVAQINYEHGKRHPDSLYFAGIAQAGADVLYILTGVRMLNNSSCVRVDVDLTLLREANSALSRVIESLEKGQK